MENSNIVFLGTEIKLNIHIDPIGELTMVDYDFTVEAYCSAKKSLIINKTQAKPVDNSNSDYIIMIDTSEIGTGNLKCKVTAYIPDGDFEDEERTEVSIIDTGIEIVKSI
jgi:hypothetical protein